MNALIEKLDQVISLCNAHQEEIPPIVWSSLYALKRLAIAEQEIIIKDLLSFINHNLIEYGEMDENNIAKLTRIVKGESKEQP